MFPLKDRTQLPGVVVVSYLLVFANVYGFYLTLSAVDIAAFVNRYAFVPAQFSIFEPASMLSVFTSMFLHAGWLHLLANMWFLAVFGPNMERAWGPLRFLFYYLIAGVAAIFLQYIFTTHPELPMLGASGAIAGVLGAYFVYFPQHRVTTLIPIGFIPIFLGIPAGIILLYWFGLQVVAGLYGDSVVQSGVAFFAHIGGFLAGLILAVSTRPKGNIADRTPFA
jgi:membrane associated rhomboid family serine protease